MKSGIHRDSQFQEVRERVIKHASMAAFQCLCQEKIKGHTGCKPDQECSYYSRGYSRIKHLPEP
eukprot:1159411-Pelagomonas_calceolata.AAC.6